LTNEGKLKYEKASNQTKTLFAIWKNLELDFKNAEAIKNKEL
jgi:hypothetical protein